MISSWNYALSAAMETLPLAPVAPPPKYVEMPITVHVIGPRGGKSTLTIRQLSAQVYKVYRSFPQHGQVIHAVWPGVAKEKFASTAEALQYLEMRDYTILNREQYDCPSCCRRWACLYCEGGTVKTNIIVEDEMLKNSWSKHRQYYR